MINLLIGIFGIIQIIGGLILISPTLFTYVSADVQFDTQNTKTWNSDIPQTTVNVTIGQSLPAVISSGVTILPPPNTHSH